MKHIQTESRMLSFNINNYVTVTLTAFGAEVYNKRYDDTKKYFPADYIFSNVDVQEGYVLKAQLWRARSKTLGRILVLGEKFRLKSVL